MIQSGFLLRSSASRGKKLFVRNFNLKTVMASYVLDLTEEPDFVLRRDIS